MRLERPGLHWFLPDEPDVLAGLREQMAITVTGMDAFAAWAAGDSTAAERVRSMEHQADEAKRSVREALRDAFVTPVSPEDIFFLSQLLDKVLSASKDVVRESELLGMPPDTPMAEMATLLQEGTAYLSRAFGAIAVHGGDDGYRTATGAADDATKSARRVEKVYRRAMGDLLDLEVEGALDPPHVREIMGRRELYRRLSRIAETMADVADRVWYAAVKEM